MTARASRIADGIKAHVADLDRRMKECKTDRERLLVWRAASADLNALTIPLGSLAALVADTYINPQVATDESKR